MGEQIYKVQVGCRNCLKTDEIEIPYGKLVIDIIISKVCRFCGNQRTLEQIPQKAE